MADSQRNLAVIHRIVGDGFLPNIIFAPTGWSDPPTRDQLSRDTQARAQEPFRSHVQRVNWASGPSPHSALDIVRIAMRRQPRPLSIQQEILDRRLRLADTAAGQIVARNAKQIAQQLRSHGNAQGAQVAERVEGKLREGFQQEVNRWPKKTNQLRKGPAPRAKPAPRAGQAPRKGQAPRPGPASRPGQAPRPPPKHQHHAGHRPNSHGPAQKGEIPR